MIEILRKYLEDRNWSISEEQLHAWDSKMTPKRIHKHEFLLRQGEKCLQTAFVIQGCLRLFSVDTKGKEHILQFAPENWWISDLATFGKDIPSNLNIDAVEDTDVLLIDHAGQEELYKIVPSLGLLFRGLLENRQAATQQRIVSSMSNNAEERYDEFVKTYASLSQRLPQHMIAAYLGITPESLSRVRKSGSQKK